MLIFIPILIFVALVIVGAGVRPRGVSDLTSVLRRVCRGREPRATDGQAVRSASSSCCAASAYRSKRATRSTTTRKSSATAPGILRALESKMQDLEQMTSHLRNLLETCPAGSSQKCKVMFALSDDQKD